MRQIIYLVKCVSQTVFVGWYIEWRRRNVFCQGYKRHLLLRWHPSGPSKLNLLPFSTAVKIVVLLLSFRSVMSPQWWKPYGSQRDSSVPPHPIALPTPIDLPSHRHNFLSFAAFELSCERTGSEVTVLRGQGQRSRCWEGRVRGHGAERTGSEVTVLYPSEFHQ